MLSRAEEWYHARVRYNEHGEHDGYREDCSGYVSFVWGLSDDGGGYRTSDLYEVSTSIPKKNLTRGDVMLCSSKDNGDGHVALFDRWADNTETKWWSYELCLHRGCTNTEHHVVPYPYQDRQSCFLEPKYGGPRRYMNVCA